MKRYHHYHPRKKKGEEEEKDSKDIVCMLMVMMLKIFCYKVTSQWAFDAVDHRYLPFIYLKSTHMLFYTCIINGKHGNHLLMIDLADDLLSNSINHLKRGFNFQGEIYPISIYVLSILTLIFYNNLTHS